VPSTVPLIDQAFLEKLERLTIRWTKSFPGLVGGHNTSRFSGPGQEFLDHRHFHHGDDLRAVNWRAYLRLEKLFLKMFRIEPRVPVRLLLDTSLSMTTGGFGDSNSKFDYARRLAAALAYVGLVRLDTMVIHPFGKTLGDPYVCSGGRHRFAPAADFLTRLDAAGETNYLDVARQFASRYPQRGLLIVLSDFLGESDCEKPMQFLSEFGHELFLVQIWADEDRTPPWEGELEVVEAESGARMELDFDPPARERYTTAFDAHCDELQRVALRHGGRYVGLPTSVSIEEAIFGPIARIRGVQ
jgi:uncharacterized protein (DUF58 family)